jgi:hypothetical protein
MTYVGCIWTVLFPRHHTGKPASNFIHIIPATVCHTQALKLWLILSGFMLWYCTIFLLQGMNIDVVFSLFLDHDITDLIRIDEVNDCNSSKFYYQGGHNPQSCHYPEKGGASYKECQDRT